MIGVIVWSNKWREQAVIWCDDHAALAYLVGRDHFCVGYEWPEPGDLVELRDEVVGELRYARAVTPIDSPATTLPSMLTDGTATRSSATLKVLVGREASVAMIPPAVRRVAS